MRGSMTCAPSKAQASCKTNTDPRWGCTPHSMDPLSCTMGANHWNAREICSTSSATLQQQDEVKSLGNPDC